MIKILFVCHGNICRSPMAEFVMKDMVKKAGRTGEFTIASAATSTEEIGNPVYPPARRLLAKHGIDTAGKTARQLNRGDYTQYETSTETQSDGAAVTLYCNSDGAAVKQLISCKGYSWSLVASNELSEAFASAILAQ